MRQVGGLHGPAEPNLSGRRGVHLELPVLLLEKQLLRPLDQLLQPRERVDVPALRSGCSRAKSSAVRPISIRLLIFASIPVPRDSPSITLLFWRGMKSGSEDERGTCQ